MITPQNVGLTIAAVVPGATDAPIIALSITLARVISETLSV
ncbi:MAG TPA: hypothetical protein V6D12_13300 [Candidatus Obscuribacterales bacterium]